MKVTIRELFQTKCESLNTVAMDVLIAVLAHEETMELYCRTLGDPDAIIEDFQKRAGSCLQMYADRVCVISHYLDVDDLWHQDVLLDILTVSWVREHPEVWDDEVLSTVVNTSDAGVLEAAYCFAVDKPCKKVAKLDDKTTHALCLFISGSPVPKMCDLDREAYGMIFMAEAIRHMYKNISEIALKYQAANVVADKLIEQQKKKIAELTTRCKDLEVKACKKEVIKEVIHDTAESEMLFAEVQHLRERVAVLSEKVDIYSPTMSEEEYEEKALEREIEDEDFDLSPFKILVVSSNERGGELPFDYVDIAANPKSVRRCAHADYVLMDTLYIPHRAYYMAKDECKRAGVQVFHISKRNKDAILAETKRLIKAKKGVK